MRSSCPGPFPACGTACDFDREEVASSRRVPATLSKHPAASANGQAVDEEGAQGFATPMNAVFELEEAFDEVLNGLACYASRTSHVEDS